VMPGADGWATLSQLRSDLATASIPVVVISVVDEPNRGTLLGAADFLVKPVSREALITSLERIGLPVREDSERRG
jgi:CheY-like chemotaxis protein